MNRQNININLLLTNNQTINGAKSDENILTILYMLSILLWLHAEELMHPHEEQ